MSRKAKKGLFTTLTLPTVHATKKRPGRRSQRGNDTQEVHAPIAGTTKRVGRVKATATMLPRVSLPRTTDTQKRASTDRAHGRLTPINPLLPTRTQKRASGKQARSTMQPTFELPTTGTTHRADRIKAKRALTPEKRSPSVGTRTSKKSADHPANATQTWHVGRRRGDQTRTEVQNSTVAASPFPNELLGFVEIYNQLQRAIQRLEGQIRSLKKSNAFHLALPTLNAMLEIARPEYRNTEKEMKRNVETMAIWKEWAKDIRGIGSNILAQVLGATQDPSRYPTPSHLWSWMELGLKHGHRQQRWANNRKGYTRAENEQIAKDMHYKGDKKKLMYIVGTCLIRARNKEYGEVYREYKKRKLAELPPAKGNYESKKHRQGHAHKMALRYMEKRFLLNLWKAWRGQMSIANQPTSAASPSTKKRKKAA